MIDNGPTGGSALDTRENVTKALSLIQSAIHKPGKSYEAEKEIDKLFSKLHFGENSDETSETKKETKLLQSTIHKPGKSSEAEKEIDELFSKLHFGENSDETSETKLLQVAFASAQTDKYAKAKSEDTTQLLNDIFEKLYTNRDDWIKFISHDLLRAGYIYLWKLQIDNADLLTCIVPGSPT